MIRRLITKGDSGEAEQSSPLTPHKNPAQRLGLPRVPIGPEAAAALPEFFCLRHRCAMVLRVPWEVPYRKAPPPRYRCLECLAEVSESIRKAKRIYDLTTGRAVAGLYEGL